MDGNDLLNDLRGDNGTIMRSVAVGYVMALCDSWMQSAGTSQSGDPGVALLTLEQSINRVEGWLVAHEADRGGPAALLVRSALEQTAPAQAERRPGGLGRFFRGARNSIDRNVVTAAVCVAAAVCGWSLAAILGLRAHDATRDVELSQRASRIASLVLEERRYEKDVFINIDDRDRIESYARKWHEAHAGLNSALASVEQLELSEQDRKAVGEINADLRAYVSGYERVLLMIRKGEIRTPQEANEEFVRYKSAAHRIEAACAAIYERATQRAAPLT